jgi:hypothetical protein
VSLGAGDGRSATARAAATGTSSRPSSLWWYRRRRRSGGKPPTRLRARVPCWYRWRPAGEPAVPESDEQIWGVKEVETQAHRFAAEFLLPAAQIYDQLPTTVDWPTLFELKRHWQVSLAALLMRARTLKRMTESTYLSAIKTAFARGWRRVEPVPLGQPEQPTKLLSFLASPDSTATRAVLPSQILESIQTASTA